MKLMDLVEQSWGYTPERIDVYVREAEEFYNKAKVIYRKSFDMVLNLTIQDCISNHEESKVRLNSLTEVKKVVESRYERYYNIVEKYEVGEYPENVRRLDEIINQYDNLIMDISEVIDAAQCIIDSAEYLSKKLH